MRALFADVGGTNARFRLVAKGEAVREASLSSASFSSLGDAVASFLEGETVEAMSLALAGPIREGECRATNLPWVVTERALSERFRATVTLLNDFTAATLGACALPREELISLREGRANGEGRTLVIGAGTGLGAAFRVGGQVCASEAGHRTFAPRTPEERAVAKAIGRDNKGRVTVEDVVSGSGLAAIHRALSGEAAAPHEVTSRAIAGDNHALATVDVFCGAYGATVSDMALSLLPSRIIVCGGLAPRLFVGALAVRARANFFCGFDDKAPMTDVVRALEVTLCARDDIGLVGAAHALASGFSRAGRT